MIHRQTNMHALNNYFIILKKYKYGIFRLAYLFAITEASFLKVMEQVMDAVINQIEDFIRWPSEGELALHAR